MKTNIIIFYFVMMATLANSQKKNSIIISGIIKDAESKIPLIAEVRLCCTPILGQGL
jgi:hypothetical protein